MDRILVLEDCTDLQSMIKSELDHWFSVSSARTIAEGRSAVENGRFDGLILDVGLPDGTGFEFCAWLRNRRETQDTPVLFLTGRSQSVDKVMGFALGADDYVVKPFDPIELRVRLQARLRTRRANVPDQVIRGPFRFDRIAQKVFVGLGQNEKDMQLTPFEFRLLYFLASREPEFFSRSALIKNVMDSNVHVNEETIYTHISSLRRKMGKHASHLESIARVGYRFQSHLRDERQEAAI